MEDRHQEQSSTFTGEQHLSWLMLASAKRLTLMLMGNQVKFHIFGASQKNSIILNG